MTIRPLVDLLDVTKRGETSPTVSEQILIRVRCLYIMIDPYKGKSQHFPLVLDQ